MKKLKKLLYFKKIYVRLCNKKINSIEQTLIAYIKLKINHTAIYDSNFDFEIYQVLEDVEFPIDIEYIIDFFEFLFNQTNNTDSNHGVVFTPKYIADFMVQNALSNLIEWNNKIKIIDPGCGCGIFLISALEYLHNRFHVDIADLIKNNIFGIDILEENIKRCGHVLELFCEINQVHLDFTKTKPFNLVIADSLKENWTSLFGVTDFDFVLGNPPYLNPKDMSEETVEFLKTNFKTTQNGIFNICYAFVENGFKYLSQNGTLEFIIPNNVLTVKSAKNLRELLQETRSISMILNFKANLVFDPIRTYSCIIKLTRKSNNAFQYGFINTTENIKSKLDSVSFVNQDILTLDANSWKFVDKITLENLKKIESQDIAIKSLIKTGIATLKDEIYFVNQDNCGFYKSFQNRKFYIESDIVRPLYKIPELCKHKDNALRYIIFPYHRQSNGCQLITKEELKEKYPNCYRYLLARYEELIARDNNKINPKYWYGYGRSQGLNNDKNKLLFPVFSANPRFIAIGNNETLFCNGYAILENNEIPLEVLAKVLNSEIMQYYITNTSYMIEGGYYCYQKKYIEKFTIPKFTPKEIEYILSNDMESINKLLIHKYNLI